MPDPTAWGLPFVADRVPTALRAFPRFVTWAAAFTKPGKVDKHPRQARNPRQPASVNRPDHWAPFRTATEAAGSHPWLAGVGYVLTHDPQVPTLPGLHAIDLDHCIDPDSGELSAKAQALVDSFRGTYWERSPSGTGLRAFATGALPGPSLVNHAEGIEIYSGDTARYVTVTGQHLAGTAVDVGPADPLALELLYELYGEPGQGATVLYAEMPEVVPDDEAQRLTAEACEALPERLAAFLRDGTVDGYPSRSEALYACLVALYGAGWEDAEVFSAVHGSPHAWAMALEHRQGKERKALTFIWRECCRARGRVSPGADAFGDALDAPRETKGAAAETNPPPDETTEAPEPAAPTAPSSPVFSPVVWGSSSAPPRDWIVRGYIPRGELTLFMGAGGTGKSTLVQQLQTAMALGEPWLGIDTVPGVTLGLYCEDSADELHRRQDAINVYRFAGHLDLERQLLWPRPAAQGSLLMTFDNRDQGTRTKFYGELARQLLAHKPDLVILDTLADFFGGNENSRGQVTQFCRLLSSIATRCNCAIVLCGHPSQAGQNSGEGLSGSTAWNNAVRSRLYLEREKADGGIEPNPNVRILRKQKANYSSTGEALRLMWVDGVFRHEHEPDADSFFATSDDEADALFLRLLDELEAAGRRVSASKHGAYAPREFARRTGGGPESERRWAARFEASLQRLLAAKEVEEVTVRAGQSAQLVRVRQP